MKYALPVLVILAISACDSENTNQRSNLDYTPPIPKIEDFGQWELKQTDGKAVDDPNATGDYREGYYMKLDSLEGNKILEMKCQTHSTTRNTWYRVPSVKVIMRISDYNSNTGKVWNFKNFVGIEKEQLWDLLREEDNFTYGNSHTFVPKGWRNSWRVAMTHCLTAYNIYIDEWNNKKGTKIEKVDIATQDW